MVHREPAARPVDPNSILLPHGYRIEAYAAGLDSPINLVFDDQGDMLIADAGVTDGNGKVLKKTGDTFRVLADGFKPPLTGINVFQGNIYVSHRGAITVVKPDGSKKDILTGLPSWGDHHNNRVVFGPDGKMYFGQGTATNSGVVGEDNDWVRQYPFFHDFPGGTITLSGHRFISGNMLSPGGESVWTGAFSPYRVPGNSRADGNGERVCQRQYLARKPGWNGA